MMKVTILKLQINHITKDRALAEVMSLAMQKKPSYVCFTNAHMTVEANQNVSMLNVVNSADFVFPDGAPVAKAFKFIHGLNQERIAGMDFFPLMLQKCNDEKLNIGLIGSTINILDKIEKKISIEFPGLNITQKISPPFKGNWDNKSYINAFNSTDTHVVFVALGCPLQETWMHKYSNKINAVLLGVGGAFPVYAGEVKRCPKWMGENGLEWIYRLIKEPKRMWKRYFYTNTYFIILAFKSYLFNEQHK